MSVVLGIIPLLAGLGAFLGSSAGAATIGALGVGSTLLGARTAAKAADKQLAAQSNADRIAQQNFLEQQRLAQETLQFQKDQYAKQLELAEQAKQLGLATQVDAQGNVTYYDKATNTWKSVLSLENQQIQDVSNKEMLYQLTSGAAAQRGFDAQNVEQRAIDQSLADGARRDLQSGDAYNPDAIASSLRRARLSTINDSFDDVSSMMTTQALRSGASSAGAGMGRLARERARAREAALGGVDLEAMQMAAGLNSSTNADRLNKYSLLASRATAPSNTFNPTNLGSGSGQVLAQARAQSAQGNQQQLNALGNTGAINAATQLNFGNAPRPTADFTKGGTAGSFSAGLANYLPTIANQDWFKNLFTSTSPIAGSIPTARGINTSAKSGGGFAY